MQRSYLDNPDFLDFFVALKIRSGSIENDISLALIGDCDRTEGGLILERCPSVEGASL